MFMLKLDLTATEIYPSVQFFKNIGFVQRAMHECKEILFSLPQQKTMLLGSTCNSRCPSSDHLIQKNESS